MADFHFKSQEAFLELMDIRASYDDLMELIPSDDPSRRFLAMIGERFDRFLSDGIHIDEGQT